MIEEHEDLLTDAFRNFTRLERQLRQAVGEVLAQQLGADWISQIPTTIREDCEAKMLEITGEIEDAERSSNLLNFTDFSQLTSMIVDHFWVNCFEYWFDSLEATKSRFEKLRWYRNRLMHSDLSPDACPAFINLCEKTMEEVQSGPKNDILSIGRKQTNLVENGPSNYVQEFTTEGQSKFLSRIEKALQQMSGLFDGEKEAVLNVIEQNLKLCTPMLIDQVWHKFTALPGTDKRIQDIKSKLPPKRPSSPDSNKWKLNLKKWFKWAEKEYLPYRYWMMVNEQTDLEIEQMSLVYEDWLYDAYPKLIQQRPDRFVYGTYQHIVKLLEDNKVILWVLIDNLPWFYLRLISRHLSENGFGNIQVSRQLSMLPSDTAFSRKSSLVGQLPNEIISSLNEKGAFTDAWKGRTDKQVIWLNDFDDLANVEGFQGDLFVYVYSRLDKLSHEPSTTDFEREEEIEAALNRFVSKLAEAMQQLSESRPSVLIISTDHGATYYPSQGQHLSAPPSAMKEDGYERHQRFIRTDRKEALNSIEWFYLDKDRFMLPQNYAVARGWRYIERRPRGYTHGGLSPEETILPLIICELGENEFERMLPSFEHATLPIRLGVLTNLAIRIRNPYRVPIENLEIKLNDYNIIFPPVDVAPKMEAKTKEIKIKIPAKTSVERNEILINCFVRFSAGGQEHSYPDKLRVKVRQLFKTDLDDEFGDMFS
ncbi:MAG: hypothetical protein CL608_26240 [Anaerolineaceae bacterium]|nr:hypothetical protein [Anaerolineaceae bacterium]